MTALLAADEASPFTIDQPAGHSPFLIACDHAGRLLPRALGTLGLAESELVRHIAWDIGAGAVAAGLGAALDAFVIRQTYSRLAIDCNRRPGVASSIAPRSEATDIPGNIGLSAAETAARVAAIFAPYHRRLAEELDRRAAEGRETILIALHSFTPVYLGEARPWHAGVLYNRDPRFARIVKELLQGEAGLMIGDNEPYRVSDETDYTIPTHGERRGLPHLELELRQDLIGDAAGQQAWVARLARLLPEAWRRLRA